MYPFSGMEKIDNQLWRILFTLGQNNQFWASGNQMPVHWHISIIFKLAYAILLCIHVAVIDYRKSPTDSSKPLLRRGFGLKHVKIILSGCI